MVGSSHVHIEASSETHVVLSTKIKHSAFLLLLWFVLRFAGVGGELRGAWLRCQEGKHSGRVGVAGR